MPEITDEALQPRVADRPLVPLAGLFADIAAFGNPVAMRAALDRVLQDDFEAMFADL